MIENLVESARKELEIIGAGVLSMKKSSQDQSFDQKDGEDRGEVIANLTLAYRHIEDARMRLGKVYQARDGGVSNSTK